MALIEYIPSTGDEQHLERIKRFVQAYVLLPFPYDPHDPTGWVFLRGLADLEEDRADCFLVPELAIASDELLLAALCELKEQLDNIYSFGGLILDELERRQGTNN